MMISFIRKCCSVLLPWLKILTPKFIGALVIIFFTVFGAAHIYLNAEPDSQYSASKYTEAKYYTKQGVAVYTATYNQDETLVNVEYAGKNPLGTSPDIHSQSALDQEAEILELHKGSTTENPIKTGSFYYTAVGSPVYYATFTDGEDWVELQKVESDGSLRPGNQMTRDAFEDEVVRLGLKTS